MASALLAFGHRCKESSFGVGTLLQQRARRTAREKFCTSRKTFGARDAVWCLDRQALLDSRSVYWGRLAMLHAVHRRTLWQGTQNLLTPWSARQAEVCGPRAKARERLQTSRLVRNRLQAVNLEEPCFPAGSLYVAGTRIVQLKQVHHCMGAMQVSVASE